MNPETILFLPLLQAGGRRVRRRRRRTRAQWHGTATAGRRPVTTG
jgi:hypothetical protein